MQSNILSFFRCSIFIGSVFLLSAVAHGDLIIDSPTTDWTEISYNGNYPDYFQDQQTGPADSDIVGGTGVPAFYTAFDDGGTPDLTDGTFGVRVRVSGASKTDWDNYLWIGMDADLDGNIDLYASLAKTDEINLHYPGNKLNISPSTTSIVGPIPAYTAIVSGDNYSFMAVDSVSAPGQPTDVDNYPDGNNKDGTDWFVSFSISFNNIVSALGAENIDIDENTPMSFVAATSTQGNSFNQDLNGAPKITNSNKDLTWVELGAASDPLSANGQVVPEPAAIALVSLGGMVMWLTRRNRARGSE